MFYPFVNKSLTCYLEQVRGLGGHLCCWPFRAQARTRARTHKEPQECRRRLLVSRPCFLLRPVRFSHVRFGDKDSFRHVKHERCSRARQWPYRFGERAGPCSWSGGQARPCSLVCGTSRTGTAEARLSWTSFGSRTVCSWPCLGHCTLLLRAALSYEPVVPDHSTGRLECFTRARSEPANVDGKGETERAASSSLGLRVFEYSNYYPNHYNVNILFFEDIDELLVDY